MNTSLLRVNQLTKHYKKFTLGPINLEVEKGTIVALVGANSSGKSTLFRLIMKIIQADRGEIFFLGENIDKKEVEFKQKVGFAGELLEPFGHLTIAELGSLVSYWYPSWDHKKFEQLLIRYHIDSDEKFKKCSKGTKKKVEFILTLCHDASLLLLDEPTAGVDIISQRKMKEDLLAYMESGEKSIVLATHMIDEVKQLSDYIFVLNDGKMIDSFNKDEIFEKWAKLIVSDIPLHINNHPNVLSIEENQIVTNNIQVLENDLKQAQVLVIDSERLTIEEVLEILINQEKNV